MSRRQLTLNIVTVVLFIAAMTITVITIIHP
jgi:hypothetical protein